MPVQNNKLDFSNQNVYVGFDVHLKDWKVSVLVDEIHHKTFSQDPSPEILYRYLEKNFPGANYHSAYEAGFCGFWIHQRLKELGVNSVVVNPADIPTTGKETLQKEDKRDSLKIAKSLRGGLLNPIYAPTPTNLEDRSIVRLRQTVAKDLARIKRRVKSFLYFFGVEIPTYFDKQSKSWTKAYVNWLESLDLPPQSKAALSIYILEAAHLNTIKRQLTKKFRQMSQEDLYRDNYALIHSVPGIGPIHAVTLLVEVERFDRFTKVDNFNSFVGLIPSTRSSGEKERPGKITPRRHRGLRTVLIEASWIAIRRDPAMMQKYINLKKRMKSTEAIVRIAKSLATRIYTVMTKRTAYQMGRI